MDRLSQLFCSTCCKIQSSGAYGWWRGNPRRQALFASLSALQCALSELLWD